MQPIDCKIFMFCCVKYDAVFIKMTAWTWATLAGAAAVKHRLGGEGIGNDDKLLSVDDEIERAGVQHVLQYVHCLTQWYISFRLST